MLRRDVLRTGIGAALALGGWPLKARADRPFTYCGWGGAATEMDTEAFLGPFAQMKGIAIEKTSPVELAKIKAMVEAKRVEWDVVVVGGQVCWQGERDGFLEKLDFAKIPNAKNLEPNWVAPCGIATSTGATVIGWSTNAFPANAGPQSWADFWDVKRFPGPRGLWVNLNYNYEAALLAAGTPRGEVYPVTPEKIETVFAKLKELKPHIAVWWSNGAQPAQLLSTGELALSSILTGRVLAAAAEGAPVAYTYHDGIIWGNWWVVPKGTPYLELAHELFNFTLSEEAQLRVLPLKIYGPILKSAAAKASPEEQRIQVMAPDNVKDMLIINEHEVDKYITTYYDRFAQLKIG
jgi:putative spermidine/putrescine transport system substrate-binding protein